MGAGQPKSRGPQASLESGPSVYKGAEGASPCAGGLFPKTLRGGPALPLLIALLEAWGPEARL